MQPSSTPGASAHYPTRPSTLALVLLLVVAGAVFWVLHRTDLVGLWLEDLPVYSHAVQTWLAGHSPYDASLSPLFFLYPPVFLYVAGLLSHLVPEHSGALVYAAVLIAAACAIPLVLARYFFRMPWLSPLFALLLFFASPRFTGVLAMCSMNIASILYCLAFLGAVPGLRRNRWEWFYLAVFLAAMVKINFLVLLLLPLLAGRGQWPRSVGCGAAVIAANLGERVIWPELYAGYEWSLEQGILLNQQFGYGPFGILASYHHKRHIGAGTVAYIVAGVFAILLLSSMFALRRRLARIGNLADNGVWLALVLAVIILVNPRVMQYDADIALLAGFVLWVYGLRTRRLIVLTVLLFLPSLWVPRFVLNPHLHGMYETLLVLASIVIAFWRLWRETGEAAKAILDRKIPAVSIGGTEAAGLMQASEA